MAIWPEQANCTRTCQFRVDLRHSGYNVKVRIMLVYSRNMASLKNIQKIFAHYKAETDNGKIIWNQPYS